MSYRYSENMTYEFILNRMLGRVPDGVDKREGSIIYDALAPAAAELAQCYMELDVVMDETFVDTASLQYLMLRCKERGIAIRPETAAVVEGRFTPDTLEIPEGTRFNCGDLNFALTEKISPGIYLLECETPGTAGNLYSGQLLPVEVVDGLWTAQIIGVSVAGDDGDTTESLRKKYYASINSQAFCGNAAGYKDKIKEMAGVGGVKVYPVWDGGGTVKLVVIAADFMAPSRQLIDDIQFAVDPVDKHGLGAGIAPIGHHVTVTGVSTKTIAIASRITFSPGWDWETAKDRILTEVQGYFTELSKSWENMQGIVVRIAQVETRILALDCVLDIADTTLDGQAQNCQLGADEIPICGEIQVIA